MTSLNIALHPAQQKIFNSKARFKVVAAGRRFGKSYLAVGMALVQALKQNPINGLPEPVYIVCPTQAQGKEIYWNVLKDMGKMENEGGVISQCYENTLQAILVNGASIYIKGSDRPDNMRGVGLAYCVIDEYADMKPMVFEQILRPVLTKSRGGCLFIGTPKGRNHFYDIYNSTINGEKGSDWEAWHFNSYDNPFLAKEEIDQAKKELSAFAFRQEYMASFEAAASDIFKPEWIHVSELEPEDGDFFISVDLAGFADVAEANTALKRKLDQTAIVIAKVNTKGWWIKDILYGRWNIKETAVRIIKAARDHKVHKIGLEKGSLTNAITPYLQELMQRTGYHCVLEPLTHGNKKKIDRITWALQGRLEHGRIKFNPGKYLTDLRDQLLQFPDPKTHDDLVDALAYIDQLQYLPFWDNKEVYEDNFQMLDSDTGY